MSDEAQTLNLAQTARYVGVSRATIYNMLQDGRFKVDPIPDTKPRRWLRDSLDDWMNSAKNQE